MARPTDGALKGRAVAGGMLHMEHLLWKPMAQAAATSALHLAPLTNKLVNYGTTPNGIAVIELASDAAGAPLKPGQAGPNTYTHEMMRDLDEAVLKARFDDNVHVIVLT